MIFGKIGRIVANTVTLICTLRVANSIISMWAHSNCSFVPTEVAIFEKAVSCPLPWMYLRADNYVTTVLLLFFMAPIVLTLTVYWYQAMRTDVGLSAANNARIMYIFSLFSEASIIAIIFFPFSSPIWFVPPLIGVVYSVYLVTKLAFVRICGSFLSSGVLLSIWPLGLVSIIWLVGEKFVAH